MSRRGLALPTVLLILALLGILVTGTLTTLRTMQRSAALRGSDVGLLAATLDAGAGAADACPDSLTSVLPGVDLPLDVARTAIGPVHMSALRLSGPFALLHGAVRDARPGTPPGTGERPVRLVVRLRAAQSAAGGPLPPACLGPVTGWAWGSSW